MSRVDLGSSKPSLYSYPAAVDGGATTPYTVGGIAYPKRDTALEKPR